MWIWLAVLFLAAGCVNAQIQQPPEVEAYLMFSSRFRIIRFNIDVTEIATLQENAGQTVALDFDYRREYYYWSNQANQRIYRARFDNGNAELVKYTGRGSEVDGIAVDWINNKLYWTDFAHGTIKRLNLDGFTDESVVIATNIYRPKGIVLDPLNDMMYFTDIDSSHPSIQRARMSDGGQQRSIVTSNIRKPNGITMDYDTNRIYFADARTDNIEYCNPDGSGRTVLASLRRIHPFDLTLYNDRVYWTDLNRNHIMNVHKEHGEDRIYITGPFVNPYVIHAVHPSRQRTDDPMYCDANGGRGTCDSICMAYPTGFQCSCFSGYMLNSDMLTCSDVNECAVNNGGCSHMCMNTEASFQCQCIDGYTLLPDGFNCVDNNECHNNRGGCEYACHNTDSGFYCSCPSGYELDVDGRSCRDRDECQASTPPCPLEAQCRNTDGDYDCDCPAGYYYNRANRTCLDVDECLSGQTPCDQRCNNQPGSYSCGCHDGFVIGQDSFTCLDVDECQENLHDCQQVCININGSYVCLCNAGFRPAGDGHSCNPINCDRAPSIEGFDLSCTGTAYGNTCTLSCTEGTLVGPSTITCQTSGLWLVSTAECTSTDGTDGINNPPLAIVPSSFAVPEDSGPDVTVGILHTVDNDRHQSYAYTLASDPSGKFYIDSVAVNMLKTHGGLDYETSPTHTIHVTTVDTGTPPLSRTFDLTITVLDVNEPPSQPTLSSSEIGEHASPGTEVGRVVASDPDHGQEETFTLASSGGGKFSLQEDQLILTGSLNYEEARVYTIVVLVEDNGSPKQSNIRTIDIMVQDENDAPTSVQLSGAEVPEVSPNGTTTAGTIIGTLTTEDEDPGDSHTYTLTGPRSSCFAVSAASDLTVADVSCFDHETSPSISVTVTARDSGDLIVQQTFAVTVTDVNEPPSAIALSSSVIQEHVSVDTVVGTLTVADPDQGDMHQLTIVTGDSMFRVQGDTLVVIADLSFSDHPNGVTVAVRAVDLAGHAYTETFTILVQDVNEPPNDLIWQTLIMMTCSSGDSFINGLEIDACVTENTAVNTQIATVMASDPDLDTLTLDIVDSGNIFILDHNGALRIGNQGLNFESPLIGQVHSVSVVAEDPGGLTATSQFNIKIINENDPPSSVVISNTYIGASVAVGQNAAVLRCIDEDVGDTHTFRLTDDAAGKFTVHADQLQVSQDLSSLAGNQYPIRVQCSDGHAELATPVTFIINILQDTPDPDQSVTITVSLSSSIVDEEEPRDTVVGELTASTSPPRDVSFTIVGGASLLFSIHSSQSPPQIRTNGPLDYEEAPVHYVVVRAETDGGSAVKTFEITVRNVNEPPGNLMFHHNAVHESQAAGALVGIVSAVDPDGDDMVFQLLTDPSQAFQLQDGTTSNTRRLVTRRELNFESETALTLGIVARDAAHSGLVSEVATYTVNVLDVNERPTGILISGMEVDENRPRGTVVGTLTVTDPDSVHTPQSFTCSLLDSASGLFQLEGFDIKVLQSSRLDYEAFAASGSMPTIAVECSDQDSLSTNTHFTITIRDVAEQPTDIQSATEVYQVAENSAGGETVAHLVTTDPDTDDQSTFQYSVSDTETFAFLGRMLITHIQLNYERQNRYDIQITSTDEDRLAYTKSVVVNVLDRNDPPTGILMSQIESLAPHTPSGMVIATLQAVDEDVGQAHEFQIETQTPSNALKIASGNSLAVDAGPGQVASVEVTIVVKDVGVVTPHTHVSTFTIAVQTLNLPPTAMNLIGSSVLEGSAVGTVVGHVEVVDPTAGDQSYCSLLDDADGRFDLMRAGSQIQLQVADPEALDYESDQSHTIKIGCRDALPENTLEATFVINVLDGPERPTGIVVTDAADGDTTTNVNLPDLSNVQGQVITSATVTVKEDAQNGVVIVAYLTLIAADGSPVSDQTPPVFELITENEYNRLNRLAGRRRRDTWRLFARTKRGASADPDAVPTQFVIPNTAQYILIGDTLDHETQEEYAVFVKATDHDNPNLVVTAQVRVVVLDVDEAPLDMTLIPYSVRESAPVDAEVGRLSVTDPDGTLSAYVYSIIAHGTPFYIHQNKVRVQRRLDHEAAPIVTIQVSVKELGTDLELVKNFDITVTDAPEPPTALTVDGSTTVTISETLAVGASAGTFVVTDPDTESGFHLSYFLTEDVHGFFSIGTGQLVLERQLDAWTASVLSLFVQVTDPTNLSFRQVITVRVLSDNRCSEPSYCSPLAMCLRGLCRCRPGFTGDGSICADVDECSPDPCDARHSVSGHCTNGFGGIRNFTCLCLPGWTGQDCTVEVDSCVNHKCNPLGTIRCLNTPNSSNYTCECKRGFEGPLCDGNTDDCADHQCLNQGECVDGIGLYTCNCKAPYDGYFCDLDTTLCEGVTCPYNGVCYPLPKGTYECRCTDNVKRDCSSCAFGYGGKDCQPCEPPFTGPNCQIDSSVCDPNPCSYGGVCIPDVDMYSCVCPENVAVDGCVPREVILGHSGGPTEPGGVSDDGATTSTVLVLVTLFILVLVLTVLALFAYRRYRRMPYKSSRNLIASRARYLSDTEEVIVTSEQVHPSRDHPSQDLPLRDYPDQDFPSEAYPSRDYLQSLDYPDRDYPMDEEPEPPPQVPSAPTSAAAAEASEPLESPPPYSPPDNLFLASALGLLPPGYEAKGLLVDMDEKGKSESEGDRAVAQFLETLAMPLADRGTLQAKGSNLDEWEQAKLGLVKEEEPQPEVKQVRKKSQGRRPSVSRERRLSVGAVAYQNPQFIPDNKVLSQQAAMAMQEDGAASSAVSSPAQNPAQRDRGSASSASSAQPGIHDDIMADQRRSHKPSLTKSQSDHTKFNPVFLDSDDEDKD